jgi:Ca-activated chloride channel homolog
VRGRIALIIAAEVVLSLPAAPQQQDEFRLRDNVNLVILDVSVRDIHGGFVSGLTSADFEIRENGRPQKITSFTHGDDPVTVGLVLDDSGSMRDERIPVINAALGFLDASNPKDEVFVTHFNDRVRWGLPAGVAFSDDPKLLHQSLYRNPPEGRTALYDAIVDSLNHLNTGRQSKKSLLLVSDGGDNASTRNIRDVQRAVQESLATIYTVGVFEEDDPDRNPHLLEHLAEVTGGEYFPPRGTGDLNRTCREIARDIRSRYTIAYVPSDTSRRTRSIGVIVNTTPHRKLIVRARRSYKFPAPDREIHGESQAKARPEVRQ